MNLHEDWKTLGTPEKLVREWKFKNFKQAWDLVNQISTYAELINHHPDIKFGWGYLIVSLYTHSAKGLTAADYEFACEVDKIAINEEL